MAFLRYERVIARHLAFSAGEALVCGMSLGYPDWDAGVNRVIMPRGPVEAFTSWHGFDEMPSRGSSAATRLSFVQAGAHSADGV